MVNALVNASEKTVRYTIPGVWIFILFMGIRYNTIQEFSDDGLNPSILSFSILLGIIAYIIYRQVADLVEHGFIFLVWDFDELKSQFEKTPTFDEKQREYIFSKFFAYSHGDFIANYFLCSGSHDGVRSDIFWSR